MQMDKTRNRTERALIAKGIDSGTARSLRTEKHTVASLLQGGASVLKEFGVSDEVIDAFYTANRPPIPAKILNDLLFENRWTCCVCRDSERSIIVHHIIAWAKSREHSSKNLAVLCPMHHGEAHTTRGLELSLSPQRILGCKTRWEGFCKKSDLTLSLKKSELRLSTWFYFNHLRIYELARELKINFKSLPGYLSLRDFGTCDEDGTILKTILKDDYMYGGADRLALYDYVSQMYFTAIRKVGLINISDYLDKGFISHHVLEGDVVLVQGLHTFSPVSRSRNARDLSEVWRKANGVRVSCLIDVSEATSSSAWSIWLRGQQQIALILKVRSVTREAGVVQIRGTALAIRDQDDELKKRNYVSRLHESGVLLHGFDENDVIEDAEPWEPISDARIS